MSRLTSSCDLLRNCSNNQSWFLLSVVPPARRDLLMHGCFRPLSALPIYFIPFYILSLR